MDFPMIKKQNETTKSLLNRDTFFIKDHLETSFSTSTAFINKQLLFFNSMSLN